MNFGAAISAGFQNYANFKGRARRSAYWYFYLFYVLVEIVANIIDVAAFGSESQSGPLYLIASLGLLLPGLSTAVRRLHDVDKSGWFILVPIYNIVLLATEGTRGPNRFGQPVK